jgi:RimJ/RimL family protein N-acetyltransferase
VRLTGLEKEDARTFSSWHNDAGFLRLVDAELARPRSQDDILKSFEEWEKDPKTVAFAVRPLDADDLLVVVTLDGILFQHGVCWLGMGMGDRDLWGKGYGSEAMALTLKYAFNELNLHRVQTSVFEYNLRSIAMCEGQGFRREGVYREFMQRDGRRYDMYLFGLLRREWEALNQAGAQID